MYLPEDGKCGLEVGLAGMTCVCARFFWRACLTRPRSYRANWACVTWPSSCINACEICLCEALPWEVSPTSTILMAMLTTRLDKGGGADPWQASPGRSLPSGSHGSNDVVERTSGHCSHYARLPWYQVVRHAWDFATRKK